MENLYAGDYQKLGICEVQGHSKPVSLIVNMRLKRSQDKKDRYKGSSRNVANGLFDFPNFPANGLVVALKIRNPSQAT